jgi:hypothetical protein
VSARWGDDEGGEAQPVSAVKLAGCALAATAALVLAAVAWSSAARRHLDALHPVYSARNVAAVRELGFPLHPSLVNRPYTRDWAGHHAGAENRRGWRTFRFETSASFSELARWYESAAPPAGFTVEGGAWGDWHARKRLGPGEATLEIRINFLGDNECVFFYVWPADFGAPPSARAMSAPGG